MGHDITVISPLASGGPATVSCRCGWSVHVPAEDAARASAEHQASMRRAREIESMRRAREIAEEQLAAEIADPTRRTEV